MADPLRDSNDHGEPGRSRTLLIVDDHAGFRAFAHALLDAAGFSVLGEAHDAASAVRAARALNPEVVLLDVALPDRDGFAVCEELLGAPGSATPDAARLPVVVLTSSRDVSSFRRRLADSRASGFIAKRDLSGPALADVVRGRQGEQQG